MTYYVYTLLDPNTNTPFYVGKGKNGRVHRHAQFRSGCKNKEKDKKIKEILSTYDNVPYEIVKDGFQTEHEAYEFEELLIGMIGLNNLTNICESARPPSQLGSKRSADTINKIKNNSKAQGLKRTELYVQTHANIIFELLTAINNNNRREVVCTKLNVTIDLFNKVKKNYSKYVKLLNQHTEYRITPVNIKLINGMKQRVYSDKKDILLEMFKLMSQKLPRRKIAEILNISVDFYDRFKNQKEEFFKYHNI